jgi:predicted phage tail protein
MSNLKTVKLYGDLGDRFGREFHLDVKNPAEAIRLLNANFKGFSRYFIDHSEPGYHILVGKQELGADELHHPVSSREEIKIVPVIAGSGDNPFTRIIIGAVLIWATGPYGLSVFQGTGALAGFAGTVGTFGTAMVLGGVSQLLFAPPTPTAPEESPENRPSYSFNGAVNTVRQGNPVQVGYGRLRVGSQMVSFGLFSDPIPQD